MNNRKRQKSRQSPELANEIVNRTLDKNRWAEQMKYLARLKAKLVLRQNSIHLRFQQLRLSFYQPKFS